MIEGVARFTVGRLFCGRFRDFLKGEQFAGRPVEFWESGGWVQRNFIVKGPEADVRYVVACMERWNARLKEVET